MAAVGDTSVTHEVRSGPVAWISGATSQEDEDIARTGLQAL